MIKYIVIAVFFASWLFTPLDHNIIGPRGIITPEDSERNKVEFVIIVIIVIAVSIYAWVKKQEE